MADSIYLITKADFAPYIDIASNLTDAKLNPRILEAQNFDLRPAFGDDMWFDFLADNTTDAYQNLLNGTTTQQGLKPILVYFTGARLIRSLDIHITPNAVMAKRNDFSDPVDPKLIAMKVTEYQNLAIGYWEDTAKYINDQGKDVYPLYKNFAHCREQTFGKAPKTYGIKGRDTQDEYYNPNYSRYYGR